MPNTYKIPKEGDLYMKISLHGYTFELRYGYYEEADRQNGEPVAIYPDLRNNPIYTKDGYPIVTAVQIPCEHYKVATGCVLEDCCSDCIYYNDSKKEIEVCLCENKRKQTIQTHIGGDEG